MLYLVHLTHPEDNFILVYTDLPHFLLAGNISFYGEPLITCKLSLLIDIYISNSLLLINNAAVKVLEVSL